MSIDGTYRLFETARILCTGNQLVSSFMLNHIGFEEAALGVLLCSTGKSNDRYWIFEA